MKAYHRYLPHTEGEIQEMLEAIGLESLEALFETIPKPYRLTRPLNLPAPLSEKDLLDHLEGIQASRYARFLGGGAYSHFIPAILTSLASRSEFYTAYTPYQPEISQGTLQAIFEYQTLMCQLTGMEVSNASMYDGASSLAEGVLMAQRITGRSKVLMSEAVHPEYRQVVQTYLYPGHDEIVRIPYRDEEGKTDEEVLLQHLTPEVNAVILQSPNFFGVVEDLSSLGEMVHQVGALLIVCFTEAIAYGLLKPPGEFGADIVTGEGQSLGLPLSFGGPYLGIFTTREKFVRNMPGRLVGETVDLDGKRGFVLTLATREQHIRRERATSNICTNEGLCALMATIFLSCLGKEGLRELAEMNLSKATYAKKRAYEIEGCQLAFSGPTFNEFVLKVEEGPEKILRIWRNKGILGGLPLARYYPELDHHLLVTVTEMNTREEIDRWADILEEAL